MNKKIITFEATDKLKEDLRVEAFNRAVTVSALIRQILEESLRKETVNGKAASTSTSSIQNR